MTSPKVIFVVGREGLERAHVLFSKGERDLAVKFYESLVPGLSDLERVSRETKNHGKQTS